MKKVITYLNEAEILGAKFYNDTQISTILNILSYSFNQFQVGYKLNPKDNTLIGLMKDRQSTKGILRKKMMIVESNVVEEIYSKAKPKGKVNKNKTLDVLLLRRSRIRFKSSKWNVSIEVKMDIV